MQRPGCQPSLRHLIPCLSGDGSGKGTLGSSGQGWAGPGVPGVEGEA